MQAMCHTQSQPLAIVISCLVTLGLTTTAFLGPRARVLFPVVGYMPDPEGPTG